jgi:hypothetical protein
VAYAPCCPGALGLETLSLEKVVFSPCSPGALDLDSFEQEGELLMDESFEQVSACLKYECPQPLCSTVKQLAMNRF